MVEIDGGAGKPPGAAHETAGGGVGTRQTTIGHRHRFFGFRHDRHLVCAPNSSQAGSSGSKWCFSAILNSAANCSPLISWLLQKPVATSAWRSRIRRIAGESSTERSRPLDRLLWKPSLTRLRRPCRLKLLLIKRRNLPNR